MAQFLVSYDLDKPGQNYWNLTHRLEGLGFKRVLLSQWVGVGDYGVEALRNDLQPRIDANDRLLVIDITGDPAAGYNLF